MDSINEGHMMKLALQAVLILVIGLVLWRIMARISQKSNRLKGSNYFQSKYKQKWKKK